MAVLHREAVLVAVVTGLVVGLSGCSSGDDEAGPGEQPATSTSASAEPSEEVPSDEEMSDEERERAREKELESRHPTAARTPGAVLVPVVYEVESSAGAVHISYRDLDGKHQIAQAPPWKHEFEAQVRRQAGGRRPDIVALVQPGPSGPDQVTCRVTVDGRKVVERTGKKGVVYCFGFNVSIS